MYQLHVEESISSKENKKGKPRLQSWRSKEDTSSSSSYFYVLQLQFHSLTSTTMRKSWGRSRRVGVAQLVHTPLPAPPYPSTTFAFFDCFCCCCSCSCTCQHSIAFPTCCQDEGSSSQNQSSNHQKEVEREYKVSTIYSVSIHSCVHGADLFQLYYVVHYFVCTRSSQKFFLRYGFLLYYFPLSL